LAELHAAPETLRTSADPYDSQLKLDQPKKTAKVKDTFLPPVN
jgi:hypothetical protein